MTAAEQWAYRHVPGLHRAARAGVYTMMESRAFGFVLNKNMMKPTHCYDEA